MANLLLVVFSLVFLPLWEHSYLNFLETIKWFFFYWTAQFQRFLGIGQYFPILHKSVFNSVWYLEAKWHSTSWPSETITDITIIQKIHADIEAMDLKWALSRTFLAPCRTFLEPCRIFLAPCRTFLAPCDNLITIFLPRYFYRNNFIVIFVSQYLYCNNCIVRFYKDILIKIRSKD